MIRYGKDYLVLSEKPYTSIQGEGQNVGCPMTFVRLQGCNVGCVWCDSYYTWSPMNEHKIPEAIKARPLNFKHKDLASYLKKEGASHVWFTGGEPTLQVEGLVEFLDQYKDLNKVYHICTAGWIWNDDLYELLDCITVDVKAPSSKTQSQFKVIDKLYHGDYDSIEFKMVVANTSADKGFASLFVHKYPEALMTFQPLYVSEPEYVKDKELDSDDFVGWTMQTFADWVNDTFRHTPMVRMGLQLHKHIWPNKMRGI